MYSVLHVTCPTFVSDFYQIWKASTDFHKSPQYQISWKSVQWEQRRYMRTDGRTGKHREAQQALFAPKEQSRS